jgi:tRNA(His) guanylyltransferase
MKDSLGDRMKANYEDRTRYFLPRRSYTIVRIDGRAFHSYTKFLNKPFDLPLIEDMDAAVVAVLPQIQGAQFAYVQSDEISILLADFAKENTSAWFDGNIQKIASISASLMTSEFNKNRITRLIKQSYREALRRNGENFDADWEDLLEPGILSEQCGCFDARVFTIPDPVEVDNYFRWRNQDAARNSVQMVARSLYSHKECMDKSCAQLQEMIYLKGVNWANYDQGLKNGRLIVKEKIFVPYNEAVGPMFRTITGDYEKVEKTVWKVTPAPIFTQEPEVIRNLIPKYE